MIAVVGWKHWVLCESAFVSELRSYLTNYLFSVSMFLVSALVVTKLAILKWPLRVRNWKSMTAHILCATIWLVNVWVPASSWALNNGNSNLVKDMAIYDCLNKPTAFDNDIESWFHLFETTVTLLLPCSIVVLATIPTLRVLLKGRKVSRRSRGQLRWQGILTVVLTAAVFCLSCFPYLIFVHLKYHYQVVGRTLAQFSRVTWYLPLINVMSNFYIYCLTVVSFRRFLLAKVRLLLTRLRRVSPDQQ